MDLECIYWVKRIFRGLVLLRKRDFNGEQIEQVVWGQNVNGFESLSGLNFILQEMRSNFWFLNRGVVWLEIRMMFRFKRREREDVMRLYNYFKIIWQWNKERRGQLEWDKIEYFRIVILNWLFLL